MKITPSSLVLTQTIKPPASVTSANFSRICFSGQPQHRETPGTCKTGFLQQLWTEFQHLLLRQLNRLQGKPQPKLSQQPAKPANVAATTIPSLDSLLQDLLNTTSSPQQTVPDSSTALEPSPPPWQPIQENDNSFTTMAAYHELGHALIAHMLGNTVTKIDIAGKQNEYDAITAYQETERPGYNDHYQHPYSNFYGNSNTLNSKTRSYFLHFGLIKAAGYGATQLVTQHIPNFKPACAPFTDLKDLRTMLADAQKYKVFHDIPGFNQADFSPILVTGDKRSYDNPDIQALMQTWESPLVKDLLETTQKALAYIPPQAWRGMVQELKQKKHLTTPEQVQAFFDTHLGRDFDWSPLKRHVESLYQRYGTSNLIW